MKLKVMITETKEIEVDDKFVALIADNKGDEALKMVEEKVGLDFGDEHTINENEPYIYCIATTDEEAIFEW
jgi:hypothetical protein